MALRQGLVSSIIALVVSLSIFTVATYSLVAIISFIAMVDYYCQQKKESGYNMDMREKIEVCLEVINLLFKLLSILGAGFLSLVGLYSFIGGEFGLLVAKVSLIICTVFIVITLLLIYDRFSIIKKMIEGR